MKVTVESRPRLFCVSLHTPRPLCKSCRHTAPCPPPAPRSRWRLCVPSGRPPGGPRGKRLFSAFAPHPCLRALPLPRPLPQVHAPTHQVHHLPTIALIPPAPAWWRLRVREVPAPGRGCEGSTLCRRRAAPPPPPLLRGPANVPLNHPLVHCTSVCTDTRSCTLSRPPPPPHSPTHHPSHALHSLPCTCTFPRSTSSTTSQ